MNAVFCTMLLAGVVAAAAQGDLSAAQDALLGGGTEAVAFFMNMAGAYAFFGGLLGVMLLLFPFRSAAIASSGVPVCTAIALAVMYLTKMELNTVSLAALIVVLGMIVDDSIITMDGYMNHLAMGKERKDAARDSARELILPMFMATAAISLMFFPCLGIISGSLG